MNIRNKIILTCGAVVVLCVGAASAGLWVAGDLSAALQRASASSSLLRNHMQADQMHDALRGDVLSALQAKGSATALDGVHKALSTHEASFRLSIKTARGLAASDETQKVLADLQAPLEAYISSADEIVDLAGHDPAAADKAFEGFSAKFEALEVSMDKASTTIEGLATGDAKHAEQQGAAARHAMTGAIVAGLVFSMVIAWVFLPRCAAPRSASSPAKCTSWPPATQT